jgi:uncharacterized protein involved in type VI secretion and phage assembly
MATSLLDVFHQSSNNEQQGRFYGVAIGIVSNNQDPKNLGRVRMKFPWLSDDHESDWCRMASPMAGGGRGAYFLPEVEDEVLVAFEHGDVRCPYVVGGMWNGKDAPPANNSDGQNNIRAIHSRSGHLIRLDDTDGAEKIEVIDKTGSNSVTIESASNNITITCTGTLKLQADQGIEITSQAGVKITANTTLDMEASAETVLKGSIVSIN